MRCRSLKSSSRITATPPWTVSSRAIELQISLSVERAPLQDAFCSAPQLHEGSGTTGFYRTCSNFSCHSAWPFWPEKETHSSTHFFAAVHHTTADALRQRSKRRVGARYFEYRATGKFHWSLFSPFPLEAFSRIHPSINSRHKVVRRHTSNGQRGAKSENLATRFSCTESWAFQRLAPLFAKLPAQLVAQPAVQWGFGSRHSSGMWSLARVVLVG